MSTITLITGANKGIGKAVARSLALDHRHFVLVGARSLDAAESAAADLRAAGGDAAALRIDVTDEASIAAAAQVVEDAHGRLDVLINNAGIAIEERKPPSEITADVVRKTYETNVFGPVAATHAFIPLLRKSDAARIVNVSSGLGSLELRSDPNHFYANVNLLAYNSSKTALNAVTVCYAQEFAAAGWKINAADPGYTATDLNGFSGPRTVEQAATEIVRLATLGSDGPTGGFYDENGAVPW